MRYLVTHIILFFSIVGLSQQEQLYTQFMFNKQLFNPAFTGNEDAPSLGILLRDQWNGLEGAPKTQVLSFATPLNQNKLGIGFNIINHTIGLNERLTLEGMYAYRIQTSRGTFSLGMQGSYRRYEVDFTDPRVITTQSIELDPSVSAANLSKSIFNFGFGIYFNTNNFYVGLAAPRLAETDLSFQLDRGLSNEIRHMYVMGGAAFQLNENISFKPQVLVKYATATPLDVDFNFGLTFREKYTIASTYRLGGNEDGVGESIDLIFAIQFSPQVMLGFAYDYTLSDLRSYQNGSLELTGHYLFGYKESKEEIINPRYF